MNHDVIVGQEDGMTIATAHDGERIASGLEAEKVISSAIMAGPNSGNVLISEGIYELEASTLFYLDPGEKNPFWTCIATYGKNIHIRGDGPGKTVLRLKPGQHYRDHPVAMILAGPESVFEYGHTDFVLEGITFDGNRAKQKAYLKDGAGCVLMRGRRANGLYQDLEFRNSYGTGLYLGNNGSGSEDLASVHNITAKNCAEAGVMFDTCSNSRVEDCYFEKCGTGLHLHGNSDNLTRGRDTIKVHKVRCEQSPVTIWCVNDIDITDLYMDVSKCSKAYGLLVHSSQEVKIENSIFKSSRYKKNSYGGASYIDAGSDGQTSITLENCILDGCWALHGLGDSSIRMNGGCLDASDVCVYLRDIDPTTAKATLKNVTLLAGKRHVDTAPGTKCSLEYCYSPDKIKVISDGEVQITDIR